MRENLNRQVASTRPSWPMVAALIISLGVLVGYELVRHERLSAAVVFAFTLAAWACLATLLLGRQIQTAHDLSLRDPLTGLPNRALLHDRIEQALARSRRTEETFALLVVDLDGFKGVNDVRGHEAGNEVLRAIARRLESVVRATDTVARVGGDEFVVLSLGTSDDHEAAALVGRLRQAIRRPYRVDGGHVELDASIGWALFPQDGLEPIELLMRADGQMYATKRDASQELATSGRGAIDRGVVRDLESALERGQVVVHYQPIIELNSGAVRGAEALVRRAHPDRLVTPSEFIPHVEQTPLVRALTLAVAEDALGRLRSGSRRPQALRRRQRPVSDDRQPRARRGLMRAAREARRRAGATDARDRPVWARRRRGGRPVRPEAPSHLGVRLSLDDLGRASSVAAIRMLPLDQVKIDDMFLQTSAAADDPMPSSDRSSSSPIGWASRPSPRGSRAGWRGRPRRLSGATSPRGSTSGIRCRRGSSRSGSAAPGPSYRSRLDVRLGARAGETVRQLHPPDGRRR